MSHTEVELADCVTRVNSINEDKEKCDTATCAETPESVQEPAPFATPRGLQKALIVTCLCGAQFFDIFTACAAIVALPTIGHDLDFTDGQVAWILTGYTLTFGAFQVPAGRLSDIYHPKPIFCIGFLLVGIFSIICAVSVHPIMLIVFRALSGLAAAMTVPSAISILVQTFPDPKEKSDILGMFGAMGAVGNCAGVVIGGVLVGSASWRWVFYLIAIAVIPFAIVSLFIVPKNLSGTTANTAKERRRLDLPGISVLTAALILFVYAISDGNTEGWGSPQIIVTLIFSVVLFIVFFFIERYVKDPALPPSTWSNKNFAPMFFYAWSAYWFFMVLEFQLVQIFQDLWHWSPLSAALHTIPIGVTGGVGSYLAGLYGRLIPRKTALFTGQILMLVASILLALATGPSSYWRYIFPASVVGMSGLALAYVGSNVTTMEGARKGEEGVVGAVLYTSYQIGSTIGIAVATAITLGVNEKLPGDAVSQQKGYAASFWSLAGMHGVMAVVAVVFVKN